MNMRCFILRMTGALGACALSLALALPAQAAMDIRSGHAGHWYAADRDGEGWVLELRDAGDAWLYWFTYDADGDQRWLTAHGQIVANDDNDDDGERIDFAQLVVTRGARFGDAFDPDDVEHEVVGSAVFRFDDCDNGEFSYNAFGQAQTFAVQRLAHVMGARCESPHGVTGREVAAHAGESGSWYDPAHNGEGFAMHWAAPDQAIVTWYSYNDVGEQYWMLGVGQLDEEGRIHFPDVHATRGARFGNAFDPDDVERFAWGTLTFELACEGGSAQYASVLPEFGSGEFDLSRLTRLQELACPWQRPALDELYSVAMMELPLTIEGGDELIHRVASVHVTDDQTVWAILQFQDRLAEPRIARLMPGADAWSVVGGITVPARSLAPDLFVRAGQVFANAEVDDGVGVVTWNGDAWQPLFENSERPRRLTGVSADAGRLVGTDLTESGGFSTPWIWDAEQGFVELSTDMHHGPTLSIPLFVSNDGARLFGMPVRPRPDVADYTTYALSWPADGLLEVLVDPDGWRLAAPGACADDCRVLFGAVASHNLGSPPRSRHEPWYWRSNGSSGFLGGIPERPGARHIVYGAADDGNAVVGAGGGFLTFSAGTPPVDGKSGLSDDLRVDGFIWMPDVGMTSVSALLAGAGVDLPDLEYLYALAISPDGRTIFLVGLPPVSSSGAGVPTMALLTLEPPTAR